MSMDDLAGFEEALEYFGGNDTTPVSTFESTCFDIPPEKIQEIVTVYPFLNPEDRIIRRSATTRLQWLEFRLRGRCPNATHIRLSQNDPQYNHDEIYTGKGLVYEEHNQLVRIFNDDFDEFEDVEVDDSQTTNANATIIQRGLDYLGLQEDVHDDENKVALHRYVLGSDAESSLSQAMEGPRLLQCAIDNVKKKIGALFEVVRSVGSKTFDRHSTHTFQPMFYQMKICCTVLNRFLRAPIDSNRLFTRDLNDVQMITPDYLWNWAYNSDKELDMKQKVLKELSELFRRYGKKNNMYYTEKIVAKHTPVRANVPVTMTNQLEKSETIVIDMEDRSIRARVLSISSQWVWVPSAVSEDFYLYNTLSPFYRDEDEEGRKEADNGGFNISAVVLEETTNDDRKKYLGRLISVKIEGRSGVVLDSTDMIPVPIHGERYTRLSIQGYKCCLCDKTEAFHNLRVNGKKFINHVFKYEFDIDETIRFHTGFWTEKDTLQQWIAEHCSRAHHYDRWQIVTKNNTMSYLTTQLQMASDDDVRHIIENRNYISVMNGVLRLGSVKDGVVNSPEFHPYECQKAHQGQSCSCVTCSLPNFHAKVATSNYIHVFCDVDRLNKHIIQGYRDVKYNHTRVDVRIPPYTNMHVLCKNKSDTNTAVCTRCQRKYRQGEVLQDCPRASGEKCYVWILKPGAYSGIQTYWLDQIFLDQGFGEEEIAWMKVFIGKLFFVLNQYDKWQVALFIKGEAGTGKSLIADLIKDIYGTKVGVLGDSCQPNFPLGSLVQKNNEVHAVLASEVKNKFARNVGASNIQEMISGGYMMVARKNQTNWHGVWSACLLMMGNYFPSFEGQAGSMFRRLVLADFPNRVSEEDVDVDLPAKVQKYEIPYSILAAAGLYLHTANHVRGSVWTVLPEYFIKLRSVVQNETNVISEFLKPASAVVVIHSSAYMTWDSFVESLSRWCKTNKKIMPEIGKRDTTRGIFKQFHIREMTTSKRWPPPGNDAEHGCRETTGVKKFLFGVGLLKHWSNIETPRTLADPEFCTDMLYDIMMEDNDDVDDMVDFESLFHRKVESFMQHAKKRLRQRFMKDQRSGIMDDSSEDEDDSSYGNSSSMNSHVRKRSRTL